MPIPLKTEEELCFENHMFTMFFTQISEILYEICRSKKKITYNQYEYSLRVLHLSKIQKFLKIMSTT
jgi:hypothetical protein